MHVNNKAIMYYGFPLSGGPGLDVIEEFGWQYENWEEEYNSRASLSGDISNVKNSKCQIACSGSDDPAYSTMFVHVNIIEFEKDVKINCIDDDLEPESATTITKPFQDSIDLMYMLAVEDHLGINERIRNFCSFMNIPYKEPKWYLTSYVCTK